MSNHDWDSLGQWMMGSGSACGWLTISFMLIFWLLLLVIMVLVVAWLVKELRRQCGP